MRNSTRKIASGLLASAVLGFAGAGSARAQGAGPAAAEPAARVTDTTTIIVIVGVPGEDEFGDAFAVQAGRWQTAAAKAGAKFVAVGLAAADAKEDHDILRQAFEAEPREGRGELWVVMIGHGSFDGKEAKFNLRGPDVASSELADWLKPIHRPIAVIDGSSSSAPFLNKLSGPNRVVITSTRSGFEVNYSRFGGFFSQAISDPETDLDKDGETSLLEAFLNASARLTEFYKTEGRLASEHPLIDDNGDGLGTPPDWFRGVRAVKKAKDGGTADGPRAQQMALIHSASEQKLSPEVKERRDAIEIAVARLRDDKAKYTEDQYYRRLELLLLELAKLYPPAS